MDPGSPHDERQTVGTPFQFGLRTMLLWVAALAALFAVLGKVGPVWQAVIVWLLVLAAVHVLANTWGSRIGAARHHPEPASDDKSGEAKSVAPCPPRFAPATRLCETARLGRTPMTVTLVGVLVGGSLGTLVFALVSWERSGYGGVIVAGISSAVVGGFLGFLSSSFLQTAVQALREAAKGVPAVSSMHAPVSQKTED
ncbi:MAG TPA: hypothetical protein VGX76_09950 [Pirellulales bacterium]|nr:hypothetical protein [Pirellulales bacterium]